MASQPVSVTGIDCIEIPSYARGYHAYCHLWTPTIGQVLQLKRQPDNYVDKYAVAIVLEGRVVGHVPYNLAKCVSQFLSRDANAKVTGNRVNRGAGYGMEVPVVYCLYGPGPYVKRMKGLIEDLRENGLAS